MSAPTMIKINCPYYYFRVANWMGLEIVRLSGRQKGKAMLN